MSKDLEVLDLKNIPCPLNVVKCKLALEKLPKTTILCVDIDKGEPEIMVKKSLENMGYKIDKVKEEKGWIRFSIEYDFN